MRAYAKTHSAAVPADTWSCRPALGHRQHGFRPALVPGTTPQQPPPGFATLSTLSLRAQLRAAGVEVLGAPSRRDSLLLAVQVLCQLTLACAMRVRVRDSLVVYAVNHEGQGHADPQGCPALS